MPLLRMDGFDDCCIGMIERFGSQTFLVYDKEKILNKLVNEGSMTKDEAVEYYEFNQLGSWVGDNTPGFIVFKEEGQDLDSFVDELEY